MMTKEDYMQKLCDKLLENMGRTRKEYERQKSMGEYANPEDVYYAGIAYAKAEDSWRIYIGCHHDFDLIYDEFGDELVEFVADN